MLRILLVIIAFFLVSTSKAHSLNIDPAFFKDYETSFIIKDIKDDRVYDLNPLLSDQVVAPCSTFKIYNTLIGLELGLIGGPDESWYAWDGIKRDIEDWNHDLTLRDAFRVSAVPAYQGLARAIGKERMQEWLNRINYGNKDMSSGIDTFWLNRPQTIALKISAKEQMELLAKLLKDELPFKTANISILKDIMFYKQTENGILYGKTGSSMGFDGKWNLGWFVGFIESQGKVYVFACHISKGEMPYGKTARTLIESYFVSQGLL